MVKLGIISDTHITSNDDPKIVQELLEQIREAFKDVDEIIHAGDVCESDFLKELEEIAPTRCVEGNMDQIEGLENFFKIKAGDYNIGVIHELPEKLEEFFKSEDLHILIYGHTHQPMIKGTPYKTLILNPGSPTYPKAPPQKKGFDKPVARPSVITLNIDENQLLTSFIINLKF